jgi:hypothetical protein
MRQGITPNPRMDLLAARISGSFKVQFELESAVSQKARMMPYHWELAKRERVGWTAGGQFMLNPV